MYFKNQMGQSYGRNVYASSEESLLSWVKYKIDTKTVNQTDLYRSYGVKMDNRLSLFDSAFRLARASFVDGRLRS